MPITSLKLRNFQAFEDYSISLHRTNILVGPNNSGKSTILNAFRILEHALRIARARRPSPVITHHENESSGHIISATTLPFSLDNVHYNYIDDNTRLEFRYSNGNQLFLYFPTAGAATMYWDTSGRAIASSASFKRAFPVNIQVIPVLGPIEQDEPPVTDQTVRRAAGTPRASRHFRNYWMKNLDGFDQFACLVEETWPGMSVGRPQILPGVDPRLTMFVSENRIDRELYWAGSGFQIWCQLLTHISRCSASDLLVVDEPEVYLHPEVQRQLLGILRDQHPDILVATHSVEIMSEADPSEILLVNKSHRSARRLLDIEGVQKAIDNIGSIQNITLTELARNGRILFVEGIGDYKVIRRFARTLDFGDLAAGSGLTPLESGGFGSWPKVEALAWGLEKALGPKLRIAAIYDRDYRCEQESIYLSKELENKIEFVHFHKRKEIENYLLSPEPLNRAVMQAIRERSRRTGEEAVCEVDVRPMLAQITRRFKADCRGQYVSKFCDFFKERGRDRAELTTEALELFDRKWAKLDSRLEIVSGKKMLKSIRAKLQKDYKIALSDIRIAAAYKKEEVPMDMASLVARLEQYRTSGQ